MKSHKRLLMEALFTTFVLLSVFLLNLFMQKLFNTQTLIPMVFVLGIFVISLKTQGYFWGIFVSLVSVLAVNYAFTFPFYAFDLISPECLSSAAVMLIVSITTSTLTTKIKVHEKLKAESDKEQNST